jgi:hypothetical protein
MIAAKNSTPLTPESASAREGYACSGSATIAATSTVRAVTSFATLTIEVYWLQVVGWRTQRCLRSSEWRAPGSGPLSLAEMLASTFLILRMPGMMVATS